MINETDNHVAWVLLIDELDEAREHLTELTNRMYHDGRIDESEYAVRLGHIYAHLNRAWNRRHLACDDPTDAEGERLRRFPEDLPPVG